RRPARALERERWSGDHLHAAESVAHGSAGIARTPAGGSVRSVPLASSPIRPWWERASALALAPEEAAQEPPTEAGHVVGDRAVVVRVEDLAEHPHRVGRGLLHPGLLAREQAAEAARVEAAPALLAGPGDGAEDDGREDREELGHRGRIEAGAPSERVVDAGLPSTEDLAKDVAHAADPRRGRRGRGARAAAQEAREIVEDAAVVAPLGKAVVERGGPVVG